MNHDKLEWNELIDKMVEDGKKGMIVR
jgi:hypothetical protein